MLEPGERLDDHDKQCCEYYATLLAMGAYDEEFALFGTVYLEDGRRECYISTSRAKAHQFFTICKERQIYPTVIETKVRRLRVHSGEKTQVEQRLKLEFAKELSQKYSSAFLQGLQEQAICPINNKAADILKPLKERLSGCFDEAALQLFEGAVEYAYEGKILSSAAYYSSQNWLKLERDFLAEKKHPACNLQREIAGFGYWDNGKVKFYTNALKEKVLQKRMEFMSRGKTATPIYQKKYYLTSYAELPGCLQHFDQEIAQRMDAGYLELITDLHALQPEIKKQSYGKFVEKASGEGRGAQNTVGYYNTLWHLND